MPFYDSNNHSDDDSRPTRGETSAGASDELYRDARSFRDLYGVRWYAHEVSAQGLGKADASLLLVSAHQVRRITPIPNDWRKLSPAALLELPFSSL